MGRGRGGRRRRGKVGSRGWYVDEGTMVGDRKERERVDSQKLTDRDEQRQRQMNGRTDKQRHSNRQADRKAGL
jgi:hypothetical protein